MVFSFFIIRRHLHDIKLQRKFDEFHPQTIHGSSGYNSTNEMWSDEKIHFNYIYKPAFINSSIRRR